MTLTTGNLDRRKYVMLLPGILHCSFPYQNFINWLANNLNPAYTSAGYHDSRLDAKIANTGDELNDLLDNFHFEPTNLAKMSKIIVSEILSTCPKTQYKLPMILYSFDCMLAPYIQKLFNDSEREVSFILIDHPPLDVTKELSHLDTLLSAHDIFVKAAKLFNLESKKSLNKFQIQALARRTIEFEEKLCLLFHQTFPNFIDQIKNINHTQGLEQASLAATILPLILSNIQTTHSSKSTYDDGNSAKLENALVISTEDTRMKYSKTSDLGWKKWMKSAGELTVLNLNELNHNSVIQPIALKKDSKGELKSLQASIMEHLRKFDPNLRPYYHQPITRAEANLLQLSVSASIVEFDPKHRTSPSSKRERESEEINLTPQKRTKKSKNQYPHNSPDFIFHHRRKTRSQTRKNIQEMIFCLLATLPKEDLKKFFNEPISLTPQIYSQKLFEQNMSTFFDTRACEIQSDYELPTSAI